MGDGEREGNGRIKYDRFPRKYVAGSGIELGTSSFSVKRVTDSATRLGLRLVKIKWNLQNGALKIKQWFRMDYPCKEMNIISECKETEVKKNG